jgi:aspartate/methionine/tyrosine aminotransferase
MGEKRGHQFPFRSHESSIVAVSFNNFGSVAENYVRISLGAPEKEIERGVREICLFADRGERGAPS